VAAGGGAGMDHGRIRDDSSIHAGAQSPRRAQVGRPGAGDPTSGERTIWIDCDVIQADGGTRTAAITGAFVALVDALHVLRSTGMITVWPVREFLAATSAGFVEGQAVLDLSFAEDSRARVDMNVVMTETGRIVEVQGTAEGLPFTRDEMLQLLGLAEQGIRRLISLQKDALQDIPSAVRR